MPMIREMAESDLAELYALALRAFKPDFEQYGHYPPLLDLDQARLRPGPESGFTVMLEGRIIGGVFAWQRLAHATLGAIFLDPDFQGRGFGQTVMRLVEERFPEAERWTLETPCQSYRNHRFYEQSGYVKVREEKPDPDDDFTLFIYEKRLPVSRSEPAGEERAEHGELIAKAADLIRGRSAPWAPGNPVPYCVLALFDADGYPTASTITPAKADGIARLYFCTGLNSDKANRIRRNPRAGVCFADATYNITLVGAMELLTDAATKNAMWYPGLTHHFSGPDDPDYVVLSFTTERYNLLVDWKEAAGRLS